MYQLYYDYGCANMAPQAALEEIGAPYELVRIDLEKGEQHQPAYKALHPHSRVPTLCYDGQVIYESAAILVFLCDRHPDACLAPSLDEPARGRFLQWIVHFTNTFQETMMHWFHPEFYVPLRACNTLKTEAEARLERMWRWLNSILDKTGPYVLGRQFSACDLELAMLAYWSRHMPESAIVNPAIKRCVELVVARPAYRKMMKANHITWPAETVINST